MSKNYLVQFGIGNPTFFTGLTPTFLRFNIVPGTGSTTPPGITEVPTSTGLYYFTYEPAATIAFLIDGGSAVSGAARWLAGSLDPIQAVDERITELGSSLNALSVSMSAGGYNASLIAVIGTTTSSFGSTLTDPSTVMGYLKRLQEWNEGNSFFTKTSGVWSVFARGNAVGTSTQLAAKTTTDSGSVVTKV